MREYRHLNLWWPEHVHHLKIATDFLAGDSSMREEVTLLSLM